MDWGDSISREVDNAEWSECPKSTVKQEKNVVAQAVKNYLFMAECAGLKVPYPGQPEQQVTFNV